MSRFIFQGPFERHLGCDIAPHDKIGFTHKDIKEISETLGVLEKATSGAEGLARVVSFFMVASESETCMLTEELVGKDYNYGGVVDGLEILTQVASENISILVQQIQDVISRQKSEY